MWGSLPSGLFRLFHVQVAGVPFQYLIVSGDKISLLGHQLENLETGKSQILQTSDPSHEFTTMNVQECHWKNRDA